MDERSNLVEIAVVSGVVGLSAGCVLSRCGRAVRNLVKKVGKGSGGSAKSATAAKIQASAKEIVTDELSTLRASRVRLPGMLRTARRAADVMNSAAAATH